MNQPNPNRRRSESAADRKPASPREQNPRVRMPDDKTARQGRMQNRQYGQGVPNGNSSNRPPQSGMSRNPRRTSAGNNPAGMPGSRPGYIPDGSAGQPYPPYDPQIRRPSPGDRVPPQSGQMRNDPRSNRPQGNDSARNPNRQYKNVPPQNGQPANARFRQNSQNSQQSQLPGQNGRGMKRGNRSGSQSADGTSIRTGKFGKHLDFDQLLKDGVITQEVYDAIAAYM